MKKVIITDLLILAVFGSTCFWSVKKDRLTALVDKILTEQTSEDEEILVLTSSNLAKKNGQIGETQMSENADKASEENTTKDYIKWVDFTVSKFALTESYEYDRDTYGTDRLTAGSICLHGQRHTQVESLEMTGRSANAWKNWRWKWKPGRSWKN